MKFLLILLLLIFPLMSVAGTYTWVDENGNLHFGSKPKSAEPAPVIKAKPTAEPATSVGNTQKRSGTELSQDKLSPAPAEAQKSSATAIPHIPPKNVPEQQPVPATKSAPVAASKTPAAKEKVAVEKKSVTQKPVTTKTAETKQKPAKATPKAEPKKRAQTKKTVTKAPAPKPAKKKVAVKKKPESKPVPKPKPPAPVASTAIIDKNEGLCGMFTNYVSNYQNKLIGCHDAPCAIYEKSLIKYQKKQQAYCN